MDEKTTVCFDYGLEDALNAFETILGFERPRRQRNAVTPYAKNTVKAKYEKWATRVADMPMPTKVAYINGRIHGKNLTAKNIYSFLLYLHHHTKTIPYAAVCARIGEGPTYQLTLDFTVEYKNQTESGTVFNNLWYADVEQRPKRCREQTIMVMAQDQQNYEKVNEKFGRLESFFQHRFSDEPTAKALYEVFQKHQGNPWIVLQNYSLDQITFDTILQHKKPGKKAVVLNNTTKVMEKHFGSYWKGVEKVLDSNFHYIGVQKQRPLPRIQVPNSVSLDIFITQRGLCKKCLKKLDKTCELDHRIPLFLGGTHELSNLQYLCTLCHSWKTHYETMFRSKRINLRDLLNSTTTY